MKIYNITVMLACTLGIAAIFSGALVHAQTTARTATITFSRPAQYTDGSAIDDATTVTYNVYQGARGGAKTKVATITATATQINTGLQPGETCWEVTAVANGVESAKSNEACKTFTFPPAKPITITVT